MVLNLIFHMEEITVVSHFAQFRSCVTKDDSTKLKVSMRLLKVLLTYAELNFWCRSDISQKWKVVYICSSALNFIA